MEEIMIENVYRNKKNQETYKPLFLNFENNKDKLVYISEKGRVWCKDKTRFLNGMVFEKIADNTSFLFDLNDIPEAFYVNNKEFINNKTGKKAVICCFANADADESKKAEYPLMVVINEEGKDHLYTFKEFESLYLHP